MADIIGFPTRSTQSDLAHELVDRVVDELRAIGFEGPAPWRILAWSSFDALRAEQCAHHAGEDLRRLRGWIDRMLAELEEQAH